MRQAGYVYHAAAADLPRGKSSVIGLIVPTIRTTVFAETILAVQEAASEMGMTIMLGNSQFDPVLEEHILSQFQSRRPAGLILVGFTPGRERRILELQRNGIPCVTIWITPSDSGLHQVGFDNRLAAMEMTEYLIGLGHRRIGIVTGPQNGCRRIQDRLTGYRDALEKHSLPFEPALARSAEPTIANGEAEAMRMLTGPGGRPSAIFAASDVLAIGALSGARKLTLRVPDELSVAGFDNMDFAAHTCPPLTTVAVPARDMARIATRLLRELILGENREEGAHVSRLATHLVIRESCAPPQKT
jgi:DNA-binding LacI/PurR family transcriptional regulator